MAGAFDKKLPGQKLRIAASDWNAMLDTMQQVRESGPGFAGDAASASRSTAIIKIRNNTGSAQDRYAVLGLAAPVILPADNEPEFLRQVVLAGVTPAASHANMFAVLLEPLAAGAIGRAVVAGVTPVRVLVTTPATIPTRADVIAGDTTRLLATASGSAHILWIEPQATTTTTASPTTTTASPTTTTTTASPTTTTTDFPCPTTTTASPTGDDVRWAIVRLPDCCSSSPGGATTTTPYPPVCCGQ